MRVSKLDLQIVLLWLAIFQFYIPNEKIYYVCQFIVACFIFAESMAKTKPRLVYIVLFLYPLTIIVSCIVNRNVILYTQVMKGFATALLTIDIFLLVERYEKQRGAEKLFCILYKISKLYAMMNILWIFILLIGGDLQKAVQEEFLFSKGKFSTAYMFIFYLLFFCLAWKGNRFFPEKWKKKLFILQAIGSIGICKLIGVSTGMVAIAAFLLITVWGKKFVEIIENPIVVVGLIVGSMFLVFGLNVILQLPILQHIIIDVLHEDMSLTGRMQLYSLLYPLVLKSGLWGGGFGSYVAATLAYHGWYNAQNGLVEIILTYGFIGGFTFLVLVFTSVANAKNRNTMLYIAILVFIMIAIVEIPFGNAFILLLSLLQVRYDKNVKFI